jgi:hydrophobe/amphiphile efflux-1 (HAE1) family protein
MARFFIDRPIFAWVIAIIIMLAGAIAIRGLPVEQYPDIAPTTISVTANYTGASAAATEDSVTQVIEQSLTGIDHLLYMASTSNSQGATNVRLTFDAGTDPDIAQVQVQNKLQQALRRLPQDVQAQGVQVTKSTQGFLQLIAFYSPDGSLTRSDLGDYLTSNLVDPLSRIDGVGQVQVIGAGYAMRIWLDPYKLYQYKLMPRDIASAINAQNVQVSAGQLGGAPSVAGQQINAVITAQSKLNTPEQFRDIVLLTNTDGSTVRIGDVARVEIGAQGYAVSGMVNGRIATGIGVSLASGANAVTTADAVTAKIHEMARFFPPNLSYTVAFDSSEFVRVSIREVIKTLIEAMILVIFIIFLFLQNLRATLIPAIAVPVVLLGTFGVLSTLGYSINTLTMFGLVLAIGLLVDDAIVVVENVERIIRDDGLSPRDATRKSMDQITGALLGIALTLSAVLMPMAFFGGSTGVIYRQFSVTIVSAMALSVLVALTLTPALCASLLRASDVKHGEGRGPLAAFERGFYRFAGWYQGMVRRLLPHLGWGMGAYVGLVVLMGVLFISLPTSFFPEEDQGQLQIQVELPPGATLQRTMEVQNRLYNIMRREDKALETVLTISGQNFGGNSQNLGQGFIRLKTWDDRPGKEQSASSVQRRGMQRLREIHDANIVLNMPPAIRGLGTGNGFDLQLKDVGGVGNETLAKARDQLLQLAGQDPKLARVRANAPKDQPVFHLDIDRNKATTLGLSINDVNDTLASAIGGLYVNDFVDRGRVKRVYLQGDAGFRMQPADLDRWFVRNNTGGMVPLAAFSSGSWTTSAPTRERYNGASSAELLGEPAEGVSSGTAMNEIERLIGQLPAGVGYEWSGISYQERLSGSQAPALYAISILFVFLCLAALYESWSLPFTVMLVVPIGVIGALLATFARGLNNDVYFQVGLLTTVGLSAKNAILIVEFAKKLHEEGMGRMEAVLESVRIRIRPIVMTSLAFMLGVLPLVLSKGAGAGGRIAIGTGVFGGMLAATLLGVIFVPWFFLFVLKVAGKADTVAPAVGELPAVSGAPAAI